MRYEIINPSDKVFIKASNLNDAGIACLLLGGGWYGLKDESGETVFPLFADEKWFKKQGVEDRFTYLDEHLITIAEVLESYKYADKRSSLNNIGKKCRDIAKELRKKDGGG